MGADLLREIEFPPAELETSAGTVQVRVRGVALHGRRLHFHRLRPVAVLVRRSDGREDRAEVTDPSGRTLRRMLAAGAGVAALSLLGAIESRSNRLAGL